MPMSWCTHSTRLTGRNQAKRDPTEFAYRNLFFIPEGIGYGVGGSWLS
jgi:hypothetical protein